MLLVDGLFLWSQHLLNHLKVLGHGVPGHLGPLGDSKKQKEIAQTEQKYVWMKSLSDTASGMLNGKAKIELETYVHTRQLFYSGNWCRTMHFIELVY